MDSSSGEPITLQEVAARAGVSVATVSRALSGRGDLSLETRRRVTEAATSLGYDRSATVRGRPAALNSRLIELVLGSFDDAWTEAVSSGARDAAFSHGYDLVLTLEREDPADDWPARVASRRPSGVILGIINPTASQLAELQNLRIPIVLFDPRSDPQGAIASIGTTDWQGGYDAGKHLAECGYDRYIVVAGVPHYRFGRARMEGFRAAIADERPTAEVLTVDSEWTDAALTEQLLRPLRDTSRSVGVFAVNDEMALAVYRAAAFLHRKIPEEVGVVGFNDEPRAAAVRPGLTSVRQPLRAMAAEAVAIVRQSRERAAALQDRVELPTELIVRKSTRAGQD